MRLCRFGDGALGLVDGANVRDVTSALDVLPTEPPPLRPVAPNLIVTPHAAYYSPEAEERAYRLCVARVREVLGVV